MREYTHNLRLESELSDLRVGYANSNNASKACIAERFSPVGESELKPARLYGREGKTQQRRF